MCSIINKHNTGKKNYIGQTEGTFKRFTQNKLSFRNRKSANRTTLVKHIWKLEGT